MERLSIYLMPAITSEMLLLVLAGGLLRVLVGIKKSMEKGIPLDRKRALLTLVISLIAGLIAVLVFDPSTFENKVFIVVIAFAGVDGIEAAYSFIVKKQFGITGEIRYDTGSVSRYYQNLTTRQRRAVDFLRKYGRIKNDDYQRINRVSHRTATRDLDSMAAIGVIRKKGTGKSTSYELT